MNKTALAMALVAILAVLVPVTGGTRAADPPFKPPAPHHTPPPTRPRPEGGTANCCFNVYPLPSLHPAAIVTGPDGALWFAEQGGNSIGRITTGGSISRFALPITGSGPFGIAAGLDGALWFTEHGGNRIGRITTAGAITEYALPTASSGPFLITSGPDGALWFTEREGNRIGRITTAGVATDFYIPTSGSMPAGITSGPDGNLWFAGEIGDKIGKITPAGSVTEFEITANGGNPWGITAGPDGALWFGLTGEDPIGRITTAGVVTGFLGPSNDTDGYNITRGPDGNLWFTEFYTARIARLTTTGSIVEFSIPSPLAVGGTDITAGPDGALWVTELYGDRIDRFLPPTCGAAFSDVHTADYFYGAVETLACHNIISGYSDGTFRPYANTTRSQLVKIATIAFGLPAYTPPNGYTFADVPTTNTFWNVVEAAAHASAIGGYACGGPGEPCDNQHRPYFRPYANVTRGQLSKIISSAAGYNDPVPSNQQHFADVPNTNTFWQPIERLASRAVISGYTCGGPGEPCDSQHRPYFRYGTNATRGQISKIVFSAP